MKLSELSILSSQLTNCKTKLYRELRKKNPIFYYFVETLMNKYRDYVYTINEEELKTALEQHGFWIGGKTRRRFCNLINYISTQSLNILATCYTGDIWEAGRKLSAFLCTDSRIKRYLIEPLADSFETKVHIDDCLYRMRDSKETITDCWHVPYNLRKKTVNYRYSLAGFPCLYLADSLETADKESGNLKKGNNRWVSKFSVNKEQVYIDLEIFQEAITKSKDCVDLINYLLTFPIRLLCSIAKNKEDNFHEEYYFPQLMMYCLCVSDNKNVRRYDGIAYSSTVNKGGINYVLPARYKGNRPPKEGHSQGLLSAFTASAPIIYK